MANTYKSNVKNLTTTGEATVFTVPAGSTWLVRSIFLANIHASSSSNISVKIVKASSDTAYLLKDGAVATHTAIQAADEPVVFEEGDALVAQASVADAIDVTYSYLEII